LLYAQPRWRRPGIQAETNSMNLTTGNILSDLPVTTHAEHVDTLADTPNVRIERIVSTGQTTPDDQWYDQPHDEWVMVVQGAARLIVDDCTEERALGPGDWVLLPAHCRHRVSWTDPTTQTVWLAIHFA
jgi:cupin 2 domain-containing protein